MTFVDLSSNLLTRGKKKVGKRSDENNPWDFEIDMTGIKAIADALSVSSSMKKLNIFRNNLGDEGIGIITSAIESKEISLCGAEPGQTDLDLAGQYLGPEDAKIIAWELSACFVSSSMNSLK